MIRSGGSDSRSGEKDMVEFRTSGGTLIKVWVDKLEEIETLSQQQLHQMGGLPFIHQHIAVMPDVHLGKGAVIGSVVPAKDAVVPNIVGVDIGCGISAYNTGVRREQLNEAVDGELQFWRIWEKAALQEIPVGFNWFKKNQPWDGFNIDLRAKPIQTYLEERARLQLGTLGGGNHFVEAQTDENGRIWFMVHFGSRHTGYRIAEYYNRQAEELLARSKTKYPTHLAYLSADNRLFDDYLHDMGWAVRFALENRWRMLERAVERFFDLFDSDRADDAASVRTRGINIHHNFARIENHGGESVVVHRKGATSAQDGEIGIIPGSMATPSYIVKGRGNPDSFRSCSHGSGRVMSRTKARKTIDQSDYENALAHTYTRPARGYVDEAPQSYKNIHEVIQRQIDLIEPVHTLEPIITLKGDPRAADD